jgi:hypothetical protein
MIDPELFQQFDLFFLRIDQSYTQYGRRHYFPWMWMKGNDHRFPVHSTRLTYQFINDLPVSGMHAVKSADRHHCIPERG